jgi:hypothetical protein
VPAVPRGNVAAVTEVFVPPERIARWVANFADRHGGVDLAVTSGGLVGTAPDGSTFEGRLPFGQAYDGAPEVEEFAAAVDAPADWGILLVRKGGFAVARLAGDRVTGSKVGQRHVQGRTKAGGQSQQRFARRRDNQARQAFEAAADHAARILTGLRDALVTGGDHTAVAGVLEDPRLGGLGSLVVDPWLPVPDPRRGVLESAIRDACSVRMTVVNR